MKEIGAVTIGKLIEAHYEKDEHKFNAYAEFIAEAYKEGGEERAERIIRSKIDGSYKNKPVAVTLDKERKEELKDEMKNRISLALKDPILQQGFEIICKENAELKAFRQDCVKLTEDNIVMARQRAETSKQLTKAEEIIRTLYFIIQGRIDYENNIQIKDSMDLAKAFLNEVK